MSDSWYWTQSGDLLLQRETDSAKGLGIKTIARVTFHGEEAKLSREEKLRLLRSLGTPHMFFEALRQR